MRKDIHSEDMAKFFVTDVRKKLGKILFEKMRIFPASHPSPVELWADAQISWVKEVREKQTLECNRDRCIGMLVILNKLKIFLKEGDNKNG